MCIRDRYQRRVHGEFSFRQHTKSEKSFNKGQKMEKAKKFLSKKAVVLIQKLRLKNYFARKAIFQPPKTPKYQFEQWEESDQNFNILVRAEDRSYISPDYDVQVADIRAYKLYTCRNGVGHFLPVLYFRNKISTSRDRLIIYSHGNASDLGDVWKFCMSICLLHGADVLAYDYTGYGISPNKPSEDEMYKDIEDVLAFASHRLHYHLHQIVLWGYSIGSCPSVHIAHKYSNLGGLVLGAPLASILSWIDQGDTWKLLQNLTPTSGPLKSQDLFDNFGKIDKVDCRMLIIHGTKDGLIPIDHSHILLEKYMKGREENTKCMFLPVEGANHVNLQKTLLDTKNPFALFCVEYMDLMFLSLIHI
eukprot:TRINITY_DN10504_c0_g1_i1.p1 TRINITY_DN10504_c0_g1~~TRINITY_DN10504_c0_g1_i1.p1  ORF type:complete len:361 (-),score=58.60 TRINITY_DN10504_c0_g1_i1:62-1144(-)